MYLVSLSPEQYLKLFPPRVSCIGCYYNAASETHSAGEACLSYLVINIHIFSYTQNRLSVVDIEFFVSLYIAYFTILYGVLSDNDRSKSFNAFKGRS